MALDLFHRIVVPTDFSGASEDAWALGRRIAGRLGSEIVLVHVFVEATAYGDAPFAAGESLQVIEDARNWVDQEMEKWAGAARAEGISVRTSVRAGSPHQEIVDLATDERADLVVMGTHGRTGVAHLVLGSVAERVIKLAPCPVLTVHRPED